MAKKGKPCFQCGGTSINIDLYGHTICDSCKSGLGLFTDETIKKHISLYNSTKNHSYEEEVRDRLVFLDKDYVRKKIKLLHIRDRLEHIKTN